MKRERLEQLLSDIETVRLLVIGDFFLDQYWAVDPALEEKSLETGRPAHQVVEVRTSPGAAGTICNNLASLKVGAVEAVGFIGDDGNGFELLRRLQDQGILTDLLLISPSQKTPSYTKPMRLRPDGETEMERFDVKNRRPLPSELEEKILQRLETALPAVDGVIVLDQVEEAGCGVVTSRIRSELSRSARRYRDKVFLGDSRSRVQLYEDLIVKTNAREAARALREAADKEEKLCGLLAARNRKPVFLTAGERGIYVSDGDETRHFPALPVSGPIDIVGAGDSVSAAVASSLCAGASIWEAAEIANLAAAVTVRKLGTTGTASAAEILRMASGGKLDQEK